MHLIRKVSGVDVAGKKVLKGKTKWYVVDAFMRNAVLLKGEDVLSDAVDMGKMVEAAVINHLVSYSYAYTPRLGHWHGKRNKEVDLVVDNPQAAPIAIEIKYRESIRLANDDGIYQFIEQRPKTIGIIVGKNLVDFDTKALPIFGPDARITVIPAFIFLYLLGHYEFRRYQKNV